MAELMSMNEKGSEWDKCPVCHESFDNYGYGRCNHPTCGRCAIKLRKFENIPGQLDFSNCPTCRQKLGRIILIKNWQPFDLVNHDSLIMNSDFDILFENNDMLDFFKSLMNCKCKTCGEDYPNMSALNRHSTAVHQLSFCDLCLRHAKLLPCEFEPLTREQLNEHRKCVGERGHPICEYCRDRYYDKDSLLQHMRAKHFVCDICFRRRQLSFFKSHDDLWKHFEESHHVCSLCHASEITNVFDTEMQLKFHRVNEHRDQLTREDRSLPFQQPSGRGGGGRPFPRGGYRRGGGAGGGGNEPVEEPTASRLPVEFVAQPEDFPTLAGDTPELATATWTNAPQRTGANDDDVDDIRRAFTTSLATTVGTNNGLPPQQSAQPTRALQSEVTGTYSVKTNRGHRINLTEEDFPALHANASSSGASAVPSTCRWGTKNSGTPVAVSNQKKSFTSAPIVATRNDLDFPSLPANSRSTQSHNTVKVSPVCQTSLLSTTTTTTSPPPSLLSDQDFPRMSSAPPAPTSAPSVNIFKPVSSSPIATAVHSNSSTAHSREQHVVRQNLPNTASTDEFPGLASSQVASSKSANKKKKPKSKAQKQASSNSVVVPQPDGIKLKNSTAEDRQGGGGEAGGSHISLEDFTSAFSGAKYKEPVDFAERNTVLYRELQLILTEEQFQQLVSLATSYMQRQMKAVDFLKSIGNVFTSQRAQELLPELIVLLQDIGLQRSLYQALPRNDRKGLVECYQCGQVCHDKEKQVHMSLAHPPAQ